MTRILLVEDEVVIRRELHRLLARNGYDVSEAGTLGEAVAELGAMRFDLVVADVRLPGGSGTELLGRTGDAPVVMMTSYATVKSAVDAMKLGAADYVSKPFNHEELLAVIDRVLGEQHRGPVPTPAAAGGVVATERTMLDAIVGDSRAMREVRERILRAAPSDLTVLVLGESGTGKELVARAIHDRSRRRSGPFVPVNCAAIAESLIESELFGYEKGAFTGATCARAGLVEAASGGTLFLDEIGELPLPAQARFLRVLQEKEVRRIGATRALRVDVRVVTATHRDLPTMVHEGCFRGDLYFRLRVAEVRLPALRDLGDDLFVLAQRLVDRIRERTGGRAVRFSRDARAAMATYSWPGNVRELENTIEGALVFCDGDEIDAASLGLNRTSPRVATAPPTARGPADDSIEEYFRRFVIEHQGSLSETDLARRLGISRKTLWERRQRLNLPRPK
jgi:two-component system response regulator AtoC